MKKYFCLQVAQFKLDGGAMYGIIPKPLWEKKSPPDELNRIDLALRLILVQTPQHNILIDTGIGDYHDVKFKTRFGIVGPEHPIEEALKNINLVADDITDLIISHLHFDHCGGMGKLVDGEYIPRFKNARLHLHQKHWEYALSPTARDSGSFLANTFRPVVEQYLIENKVHWLHGEEGIIIANADIKFKVSHGHTPFLVHPFDDKFIYLADLIPTSNHINIPWVMGYDIYPGQTVQDKALFLSFVDQKKLTVVYEHDPKYWGSKASCDSTGVYSPNELMVAQNHLAYPIFEN